MCGEHRAALFAAIHRHGGVGVDRQGDAVFAAFPTASGALAAARDGQAALQDGRVRVRMGVHTGTPLVSGDGYVGLDVHRALLTLPRRQRAAIVLHYFEDRPVTEIATLLGCGDVTVRTHLARGRKALAERLGEELTDDDDR